MSASPLTGCVNWRGTLNHSELAFSLHKSETGDAHSWAGSEHSLFSQSKNNHGLVDWLSVTC